MIHQGQRLPFRFKTGDDLLGIHAQLDDLQRNAAADRFFLFSHPDRAHAPFTQSLQQAIASDYRAGILGSRLSLAGMETTIVLPGEAGRRRARRRLVGCLVFRTHLTNGSSFLTSHAV